MRLIDLQHTGRSRNLGLTVTDRIDDVVAMWDVSRARDAAWTNGLALWALRDEPTLASEFLLTLDRMVGFASRGLLVPADSFVQKLGRLRN